MQEDRCLDLAGVHFLILSGQHLLTCPQVFDYVPDHDSLRARVGDVFNLVVSGDFTPSIVRRYDLADAPQAHRDLASRRTTGKLLLP